MKNVLDMTVVDELLSLSDDGDPELLLDLIQLFLDDGPAKIEAVVQGLAEQDFDKMERAAHALKGSAATLGFTALSEAALAVESAAKSGEDAAAIYPSLEAHLGDPLRVARSRT